MKRTKCTKNQYSKMPIEKLIKILQDIEAKSNKKIEIGCNGTLMTLNGENFIIMTNEPQWQ